MLAFLGIHVRKILEGTFAFPLDTNPFTKLLLEEAHNVYSAMGGKELSGFVNTNDFQYLWLKQDEKVQSSESNLHMGHYTTAAHSEYLSALHSANLSLASITGVPLDRWGNDLTGLLEKAFWEYLH